MFRVDLLADTIVDTDYIEIMILILHNQQFSVSYGTLNVQDSRSVRY